jgi:hypothetical protein
MKKEDFFETFGDIDPRHVQSAHARRPARWKAWGAAAACFALLAAHPLYRVMRPNPSLHSYRIADYATEKNRQEIGQWNDPSTPTETVQDQVAAETPYDNLMAALAAKYGTNEGGSIRYPDWFGGAYLAETSPAQLTVLVVETNRSHAPSQAEIQKMAGSADISFVAATYAHTELEALQEKIVAKMQQLGVFVSCRMNVIENCLDLTITTASEEALAVLAELDPAETAINVTAMEATGNADYDLLPITTELPTVIDLPEKKQ